MPEQTASIRSSLIWFGISIAVIAVCIVNSQLEETTLMRVLSWIGAGVGLIIGLVNLGELLALRRAASAGDKQNTEETSNEQIG